MDRQNEPDSCRHGTSRPTKVVDEGEETGAQRYVRTGADHYSLAFTYAWMAVPELAGDFEVVGIGRRETARMYDAFVGISGRRRAAEVLGSY